MSIKLGVIMDPIGSIQFKKDTTLAMLLEAQQRGYELFYMQQADLFLQDEQVQASMSPLKVANDPENWFSLGEQQARELSELDIILMRKDPPFDMNYIFTTYLLELAEAKGTLVVNKPQSLRDANEKLYTAWFPECTVDTVVTSQAAQLRRFIDQQQDVILKPLDSMGGSSIFRVKQGDANTNVIIETLTRNQAKPIMAQRFIPEISEGDKRILLIDGEPVPYALARIPSATDHRANLAAGGTGKGIPLSERDRWICKQLAPTLKAKGLIFVGIDVIGDYLTEINVTSPTCVRELDQQFDLNISATLMDCLEQKITK
ncbi:MAG: glutathione synthase [Thioalkalispiraceae bacterium]|jgi:glutathione synthase